ncbi:hypothetical protein [Bosea minatitlanensis]|uniref:Uncharacterized protein n=1 Tax=Bosea minatitlanensis TaxID=128782 RepID=A0ABW0EZE0_9HYPH|nr:hypothetical protein [Bosea minatitlanensis]MCT4491799.1 hypothetical protein [Bosea minatitlanensis]
MALSKPRDTIERGRDLLVIPVAAATAIFQGALVAVNASGYAVPGSVATTLKAAGRAEETIDNSGGAAGALSVTVKRGVFKFKNSASDACVQASVLSDCFIVDDETVAKTDGSSARSKAGKVLEVEATGVWVEIS